MIIGTRRSFCPATLECGGLTPLSFISFLSFKRNKRKKERKKESGVKPPHSKESDSRPGGRMLRSAVFSRCRTYRYSLARVWNPELPSVLFVGLNPSTADEHR